MHVFLLKFTLLRGERIVPKTFGRIDAMKLKVSLKCDLELNKNGSTGRWSTIVTNFPKPGLPGTLEMFRNGRFSKPMVMWGLESGLKTEELVARLIE